MLNDEEIEIYVFIIVQCAIFLYLNYEIIKRRNYYPFLERSSKLMILSLNLIFASTILFPTTKLMLSDDSENNHIIAQQQIIIFHHISCIFSLTQSVRGLRIYYVLKVKKHHQYCDIVMKNEFLIIILIFLFNFVLTGICNFKNDFDSHQNNAAYNKILVIAFLLNDLFCIMSLLLAIYYLKDIPDEYNITMELIIVTFFLWASSGANLIRFHVENPANILKIYFIYGILLYVKNIAIVIIQIIIPIFNSSQHHPVIYQITDDLITFLQDSLNVKYFYKFLQYKKAKQHIEDLIRYMEIQQENFESFSFLYGEQETILSHLNDYFDQYKQTKSFMNLQKVKQENLRSQERLYLFKMNHFPIQKKLNI